MLQKEELFKKLHAEPDHDYGRYLKIDTLFKAQKTLDALVNSDELQFQIVHQVEELWMKLGNYTLCEIHDDLMQRNTFEVLAKFKRVHIIQKLMIQQLELIETMSPKAYQEIRLSLGNGSGQESPGFKALLEGFEPIWKAFQQSYLKGDTSLLLKIYENPEENRELHQVCEALCEFDELFQKFRYNHIMLVNRSIGMGSKSLKGVPADLLMKGAFKQFFPELWEVRNTMTDTWGAEYGSKRESLKEQ